MPVLHKERIVGSKRHLHLSMPTCSLGLGFISVIYINAVKAVQIDSNEARVPALIQNGLDARSEAGTLLKDNVLKSIRMELLEKS
jgi:hypothetical protein